MAGSPPLELLRQAMAAARASDRPRTRELLQEVTRLDPRNETAWLWLAGVVDTAREAVAALERVVALNPANEKARGALRASRLEAGIEAAKAKDVPTARRLLRAAVADEPNSEQGWFWLATVCESPADGLAYLQRVLTINPDNAAAQQGVEYYQAKLRRKATESSGMITTSGVFRAMEVGRFGPDPSDATPTPFPQPSAPTAVRTVLVVDESRTIRKLIAMTASVDGFRVTEAADANEATTRIQEDGTPDLMIVDAALPGTDGYELCKLIRHNPATRQTPVIMLTGKDGLFDKIRGAVAGVTAVLPKPLDPEELLQAVRACLPVELLPTA
jgi:twitching motility two-component system response regulator PilG